MILTIVVGSGENAEVLRDETLDETIDDVLGTVNGEFILRKIGAITSFGAVTNFGAVTRFGVLANFGAVYYSVVDSARLLQFF